MVSHDVWQKAVTVITLSIFIPVSGIFDNEDDIFIFSRNVRKSSASKNYFKKNQKYYEILTIYESNASMTTVSNI